MMPINLKTAVKTTGSGPLWAPSTSQKLGGGRSPTATRGFNSSRLIHPLGELQNESCNSGWRVWGGPSEDPWPAGRWAPEVTGPRVTTADSRINEGCQWQTLKRFLPLATWRKMAKPF